MSRATAAPSAAPGALVVELTPVPSRAASTPAVSRSRSAINSALEGTPGRMRVLAFVAAVVAAAFGLVGAMSLWSSAGALERADHNTAQVVRILLMLFAAPLLARSVVWLSRRLGVQSREITPASREPISVAD